MKKIILIVVSLVLMCNVVLAYAENNPEGLWINNGNTVVLMLKINNDKTCSWIWVTFLDGNVSMTEVKGTWKKSGSTLSVTTDKGKISMGKTKTGQDLSMIIDAQTIKYSISGNVLSTIGADGEYTKVPVNRK